MAPTSKVGIGLDDETVELLTKLQQVTGVSRREHLRRAVERYFNQADAHLTEAAQDELARIPASTKALGRADRARVLGRGQAPVLKKGSK